MAELRFINDEQIRSMVERDKKELDNCFKSNLCKSTLLLSGSIIEAILVDFFLAFPRQNLSSQQVLQATLFDLINWAFEDGLITSRTQEISTVIKNYRNLIHPGREYRLQERVDIHTATVAASLVEIVIEEISESYSKKLGYTAEQAIKKVKLDPSCTTIFQHIIDTMVSVERIKLFKAIPAICEADDNTGIVVSSLVRLHSLLKNNIPYSVISAEAARAYDYIRSKSRLENIKYLRFFSNNLDTLSVEQRNAIIAYFLGILSDGSYEELTTCHELRIYSQIGEYLNSIEGMDKLYDVIKERLWIKDFESTEAEKTFLSIIHEEIILPKVSDEHSSYLLEKLSQYASSSRAKDWAEYLSIPF